MLHHISIIFFSALISFGFCELDIEQVITTCCNEGEDWGQQKKHCSEYKFNLDNNLVPPGLHGLCLSTMEICCAKQHRIFQCTTGSVAAKNSADCNNNEDNYGTEFFKDCCEACKIGLVIGSSGQHCSTENFSLGSPWDDVIENCCADITSDSSETKNMCDRFDKLCDHVCVNTDNSYICKCNDGFELQEDKITCAKQQNLEDNEIPMNESMDCATGYVKNKITNKCVDLDECENGDATCHPTNEVCFNTMGSFKCLPVQAGLDETHCTDGFRYNARINQCTDINECDENSAICDKHTQLCLNTKGGYECKDKVVEKCMAGLKYNIQSKQCEDIDECLDPTSCDEGYRCINVVGSYECMLLKKQKPTLPPVPPHLKTDCALGFKKHKDNCVDMDECSFDKDACDANQICINQIGSYRCDCKIGFTIDPITKACEDVNECQINNHECLENQRCDNTLGSYRCIRLQSCGTGYTYNAELGTCDDDDECILHRHNCREPYECLNTKGSFRCMRITTTSTTTRRPTTPYPNIPYYNTRSERLQNQNQRPCSTGFERNSNGVCVDLNECEINNPCARNQKCINTNGAFRCQNSLSCAAGYVLGPDGNQCIDIDECANREANCGPDQICKNKPGGYVCVCPAGFIISQNRNCEDVNECEYFRDRKPCPSNADCINTRGSFRCECKSGFKNDPSDDRVCVDVDECKEYPGLCHQRCVNYWGSYKCGCNTGFKLNENNRTCDDIDECFVHKGYKLCMGICENTPGSYQCTCPPGYKISTDTRSCDDIDECSTNPGICRNRNDICTNLRGSHRCTAINCPYGYMRDPDKKHRCKRITTLCDQDDIECFRKPSSFSFNFISMIPNMSLPVTGMALFNLQTTIATDSLDFDLKILNIHAPDYVHRADDYFFSLVKVASGVNLYLMQSLEGPQDVELELTMNVYADGHPSGSSVAKIFLLVSEYPF